MSRAVLYTDGGSQPNPGLSGWAGHGYIYKDNAISKKKILPNVNITANGYTEDNEPNVEVEVFFDYFGSTGIGTNNAAEINSVYYSLNELINNSDYSISHINIFLDSEYVRKGITEWSDRWIKNNWYREDGNPVSNQLEWKRLLELLDEIKTRNITYELEWVKGHSGNYGNNIADILCNIAINALRDNKEPITSFKYFEPYLYYESKPERHPYLSFKRVYFNSISNKESLGYYFLEDSDKEEKYVGRKYNNVAYSVIKLSQPIPLIEEIKIKEKFVSEDLNTVVLLKLDRVYSPEVYKYLSTYGRYTLFRSNSHSTSLAFLDNKPITLELDPPGLSLYAMQSFQYMENTLKSILDNTFNHTSIDITDYFFIKDPKSKKNAIILNPNIKPNTSDINIPFTYKEKQFKIKLQIGSDVLPRSNLKRIETYEPIIKLLLISQSENSFQYMTYIGSKIGDGVWSNLYTNTIYF